MADRQRFATRVDDRRVDTPSIDACQGLHRKRLVQLDGAYVRPADACSVQGSARCLDGRVAEQRWVSDAEVAEVPFTAFTSRRKADHVTARLIVRRVKRLTPAASDSTGRHVEQAELFAAYRYHAVLTDSPLSMLDAEACHRRHAIIEQVIADLKAGPLAHLPSGRFTANGAWLVLAAMAFTLTRAAGCAAGGAHARATTATIRTQLIAVAARIARSARRLTLHLPRDWPWETGWQQLFAAACGPPAAAIA